MTTRLNPYPSLRDQARRATGVMHAQLEAGWTVTISGTD